MSAKIISRKKASQIVKTDLRSLMWLYEKNYHKLLKLTANFTGDSGKILPEGGQIPIFWKKTESSKYTDTWHLTYRFESGNEPDLWVRVYHDTEQAEAWKVGEFEHIDFLAMFKTEVGTVFDKQWNRNMLLFKWLEYLLLQFES